MRELENVVEQALILNTNDTLSFGCLNMTKTEKNLELSNPDEKLETLSFAISRYIRRALAMTNGRINGKDGAAEILGINPNTLRNRMKKLGIVYGRKSKKI